ncbi:hypothetical protein V6N12_066822 [Hibiscus sabdariffa]|uniref:Trafficking protein particle complex subunit 2 n=1 Tax=Hibiscus sabdariffa TaxID=183260 RepID=A0ABR2CAV3_9ROSI
MTSQYMKLKWGSAAKREDAAQLHQFILHAALDIVQDLAWTTSAMFLKAIDRFNDLVVTTRSRNRNKGKAPTIKVDFLTNPPVTQSLTLERNTVVLSHLF